MKKLNRRQFGKRAAAAGVGAAFGGANAREARRRNARLEVTREETATRNEGP